MRRVFSVLLIALLLICFIAPAEARAVQADEWNKAYLRYIQSNRTAKRAFALGDLTKDGQPELMEVSIASKRATIKVYTLTDGKPATQYTHSIAISNIKSLTINLRKNGDRYAFYVQLKASSGKKTVYAYRAVSPNASGKFETLLSLGRIVEKKKATYTDGSAAISSKKYTSLKKAFESNYKNVVGLSPMKVNAGERAKSIDSKWKKLVKQYSAAFTVKRLSLSKTSATLKAGSTLTLKASRTPKTAVTEVITWTSSKPSVAAVDSNGKVTALAAGSATITAKTVSGVKKSAKVTVKATAPKSVSLDQTTLTLKSGAQQPLKATLLPAGSASALSWLSSDQKVATVSSSGVVKAVAQGRAILTVKTKNGVTASATITVSDREPVIVDLSQHNAGLTLDWPTIAKNVDLMIFRCGVTRTYTPPIGIGRDDKFAEYAKKCQKYGIPFGVYYYGKCSSTEEAIEEAKMTWQIASPYNPLFYIYDAEEACLTKELIETYMKTLQALGAKKTGYYIAHHRYSQYKLDTSLVDFIWIPHYGKNTGLVNSSPSYPCDMHQYTSVGRVPGISGGVDVSRLMGSKGLEWYLAR